MQAGMVVGSAAFARLQSNADFLEARDLARTEVSAAIASGELTQKDCDAEKQTLQK